VLPSEPLQAQRGCRCDREQTLPQPWPCARKSRQAWPPVAAPGRRAPTINLSAQTLLSAARRHHTASRWGNSETATLDGADWTRDSAGPSLRGGLRVLLLPTSRRSGCPHGKRRQLEQAAQIRKGGGRHPRTLCNLRSVWRSKCGKPNQKLTGRSYRRSIPVELGGGQDMTTVLDQSAQLQRGRRRVDRCVHSHNT